MSSRYAFMYNIQSAFRIIEKNKQFSLNSFIFPFRPFCVLYTTLSGNEARDYHAQIG